MTSVIDFLNSQNIAWFPINLTTSTVGGKPKKFLMDMSEIGYKTKPKPTDFKELPAEIIKHRQGCVNRYQYIAIDTSKFAHIDIDTPNYPKLYDELAEQFPYFKSATKSYGKHIFCETTAYTQKDILFDGEDGDVELLFGGWSYCRKDAIVENANVPIPKLDYQSISFNAEYQNKKARKEEYTPTPMLATPDDKYVDLLLNHMGNPMRGDKYVINREDALIIATALRDNGYSRDVFIRWAGMSPTNQGCNMEWAETLWDGITASHPVAIYAIQNIAKQHFADAYKQWGEKYQIFKKPTPPVVESSNNDDFDFIQNGFTTTYVGKYFAKKHGHLFVMNNETLYCWNGIYWEKDNKRHTAITNYVDTVLAEELLEYADKKMATIKPDNNITDHMELMKDWHRRKDSVIALKSEIKKCLQNSRYRKGYIEDILHKITRDDIVFDANPYLFVFNNAVFNLETGCVEEPKPEHYNTTTCGYDYEEPDQSKINTLKSIIEMVLPDERIRSHYFEMLATGLCGLRLENLFVATGVGGNGKSLITELMALAVGDYGYKLQSNTLCEKMTKGATPEIANLNNKRFVYTQEPDKKSKITCSTMKEITGGDNVNARQLYSGNTIVNLLLTLLMEANELPQLDEVNEAVSRRLDVIPFNCKFVEQWVYDDATDKTGLIVRNPYFKTQEFKHGHKLAFFHILQPYFQQFKRNGYKLSQPPKEVVQASHKYMAHSDNLFDWFNDNYELCEGEMVKTSDVFVLWKRFLEDTTLMTKRQKAEFSTKKKLEEKLAGNILLKKYIKQRKEYYGKTQLASMAICGWKRRPADDEEDQESGNEDEE